MTRRQLLRAIADAKREAAKMRRMFPHSWRWAVARLPVGDRHNSGGTNG